MPTFVLVSYAKADPKILRYADASSQVDALRKLDAMMGAPKDSKHTRSITKIRRFFQSNNFRVVKQSVPADHFYRRMARPVLISETYVNMPGPGPFYSLSEDALDVLPAERSTMLGSLNSLHILVTSLQSIFRSVEPTAANLRTYGHDIRNVLLLACMEFENECKGVLRANQYKATRQRWNTQDYVKLARPLRLSGFSVSLGHHPSLAPRQPFRVWKEGNPTLSLPWYNAYNNTKHDREGEFASAQLGHAIDAVAACAIMLAAEYRFIWAWRDRIGDFFKFSKAPNWKMTDRYIRTPGTEQQPIMFPF